MQNSRWRPRWRLSDRSFKDKYVFLTNKGRNKCNTSFNVILTVQSIYGIIFMIQGHPQGQKVN